MWIREVDLPIELVEAHRAGQLVLFVGAGASRDAPADLPDFRRLTSAIAAEAQVAASDADLDRPDVFLGRLKDQQVDIHRRVAAHIDVPTSRPNRLHGALARLALAGEPVRIVTTNFDLHLSSALHSLGARFDEYIGPALPMGDDFTGVVYLHGSLRQEPRRLVVTDGDFGRAYLRDAWAARFLERMFATFTVLFVGYSHGDVVMRYLARALVPGSTRYVLTDRPDEPDWRRLGLLPIGYKVDNGSHAALGDAVAGWASLASMGVLDHRRRIAELVSAPPSQIPEEASYLEAVVENADHVRLFTELARGEAWLRWVAKQPVFRRLFNLATPSSDTSSTLAWWFAEHFVIDEAHSELALSVVHDAGGHLGSALWEAIGHRLHVGGPPRPDWLGPWLVLLVDNDPGTASSWLEYALTASRWPQDRTAALLLFDHLTLLQTQTRPSFGFRRGPRFDVRLRGSSYELDEAWRELFAPNLDQMAPDVLAIVDRHLRHGVNLLTVAGTAGTGWDPITAGRSAIEPHTQDRHRDPADVLIDAGRDCLETLLNNGNELGEFYVRSWADTEVPILRRLAIHAMAYRNDQDGTSKIKWLRERRWLFDQQLRHEVFHLIEVALPTATDNVADALVTDALNDPADLVAEEHRSYVRFNTLTWIKRHAPDLRSAATALEQVQAENPEFVEREHPDLLSRMEIGWVQPRPPMTADELHQLIADDAAGAIAELRRYENVTPPSDGPTWRDALSVLLQTVKEHPADGFTVLDAAGGDHHDVMSSVIAGWSKAEVDVPTAERILQRLTEVNLTAVANALSQLLADGGDDAHPTKWHRLPAARTLASALWAALGEAPPAGDIKDWLTHAINDPAGRLAWFWVNAIAADWKPAGESWAGLPTDTSTQLEIMLNGTDARTASAEVIFASQLLFFFGADRNWCTAHVLPLLQWSQPERARRTWDGYLIWGRFNDTLLTAGLLDAYLDTAHHIGQFREDLLRQFASHLAAIALASSLDPLSWLPKFTATVEIDQRVDWMSQVALMLRDLDTNRVEHQWNRWMRQYWQDRVNSIPRHLESEEAAAMATWIIYLTQSLADGVALATTRPAGLSKHTHTLHNLNQERLRHAPVEFAKLIAHLLRGTKPPFWGCHNLSGIVSELRNQAAPTDIDAIIAEAIRLGCPDAAQW